MAHSSLQDLSTNIRFPVLVVEDKKAERIHGSVLVPISNAEADEGTGRTGLGAQLSESDGLQLEEPILRAVLFVKHTDFLSVWPGLLSLFDHSVASCHEYRLSRCLGKSLL